MAKGKGQKARRRVSFNVPEKKEDSDSDDAPAVNISIQEDAQLAPNVPNGVHDEVETMEGSEEEDSDSESEESDGEEETKSKPMKRKPKRSKEAADLESASDSDTAELESESESGDGSSEDESGSDEESDESGSSGSELESEPDEEGGDKGKETAEKAPSSISSFSEMSLDPRVERAIERLGWRKPTPVQSAVIPAALSGRDVLVSAPTGSGKTGAYAVPIVQHICRMKPVEQSGVRAVVLVPTRELVYQVSGVFKMLCKYIIGVQTSAVTSNKQKKGQERKGKKGRKDSDAEEKRTLAQRADIIVATPASILEIAGGNNEKSVLNAVEFVVVDEADLALSYGYENDARAALEKIPTTAQSMMLSATLEAEGMDNLKKVILRRPLTIKVTAEEQNAQDGEGVGASHYFARLKNHKDRYLVTYAMLRLNVICGKVLIFVNHIAAAFRLKLFLDQFKVKSAVLNSELPANSRMHCVDQFNAGIFDILIATDEAKKDEAIKQKKSKTKAQKGERKKRKRVEKDEEFGLSRGVDFRDVAAVFNFDIPDGLTNYTHRAGRTARAGRSGTVLSLVCSAKEEKVVQDFGRNLDVQIGPLTFRMDQIEAFRYRVEDCLRMVTDAAVHAARLADVQREMVNSEQLQDYFEENPQDFDALRHNLSLAKNTQEHLGHIPSYLLPPALRGTVSKEPTGSRFRTKRRRGKGTGNGPGADPLKSFSNKSGESSRDRFHSKHGIKKKAKKEGGQLLRRKRRSFKTR